MLKYIIIKTNNSLFTFNHALEISLFFIFRAKCLDCPGADLGNVLMLETPDDARRIHYACMGSRTVIVGTSFVGTFINPFLFHIMPHFIFRLQIFIFALFVTTSNPLCVTFEGMEVAAYVIDMASSITIIASSELPYQKTLGPEIGKVTMMVNIKGLGHHKSKRPLSISTLL